MDIRDTLRDTERHTAIEGDIVMERQRNREMEGERYIETERYKERERQKERGRSSNGAKETEIFDH